MTEEQKRDVEFALGVADIGLTEKEWQMDVWEYYNWLRHDVLGIPWPWEEFY